MIQFQRIAVPLSLSEPDAGLLRYAALVCDLGITSEVRFVHILTPAHSNASAETASDAQRRMEAEVAQHFGSAAEDVSVSCHVVEGNRVDRLVEFSIEHRADLILLGHRKARTGRRSLAQRLAMVTPSSVWLVPEGSADHITRIMAPVDFSDHSADSLGAATALARLLGLDSCEALHVHFDPSTVRYDEQVEASREHERATFDAFLADVNTHGIDVDATFMESSRPAEAILRRADQTQTDLIVMSTRGRSVAAAILLGSETAQVMVEATAPVLAVKHFGAHLNLFEALRASKFWARPNLKTN
jgi:SulP family sulfate permease